MKRISGWLLAAGMSAAACSSQPGPGVIPEAGAPDAGARAPDGGAAATDAGPTTGVPDAGPGTASDAGAAPLDSGGPLPPPERPRIDAVRACGVGPFPRAAPYDMCGPTAVANCPSVAPDGATPALLVATCAIAREEASCTPLLADCPYTGNVILEFLLVDPNQPQSMLPSCTAGLSLAPSFEPDGTVEVHWSTFEYTSTCAHGPTVEGYERLSACCATTFDIHFPRGEWTTRVQMQLDWVVL